MFPRRSSIWIPLLKVLDETNGPMKPAEAAQRVAEYFPELTQEDKQYRTPKGVVRWSGHDVPWARYDMVQKGFMLDSSENPGQWRISEEGRAYLKSNWETWAPEYTRQNNAKVRENPNVPNESDDTSSSQSYWWVNQGQSYNSELNGEYIWAPIQTTGGTTPSHWARVSKVRPGDVLIHYSNGAIRAISIATHDAEQRDNPHSDTHNAWAKQGWAAIVHYYELPAPYPREKFPESLMLLDISDGPFDRRGQMKQGYLWNFSAEAFQMLTSDSAFPWPTDIPLTQSNTSTEKALRTMETASPYGMEPFDLHKAQQTITEMGYKISLDDFLNVLLALQTRPFVIFSGRSGTGKTTLAYIIALLFGWPHYRVAVSPAWADPSDLLGFVSPLSHERVGGALENVLRSSDDDALLCLDEFNVAKVEHYFADFISAMTGDPKGSLWGPLPNLEQLSVRKDEVLHVPKRLRVIATMNFDDSVQSITPRVLDRANVMEFDVLSADALVVDRSLDLPMVSKTQFHWPWNEHNLPSNVQVTDMIRDIWSALRGSRGHLTHRAAQEMYRYILLGLPYATALNRNDDEQREALLDRQIAQRILPKFHGTAAHRDIMALTRLLSTLGGTELVDYSPESRLQVIEEFRNWGRFRRTLEKIEQLVTTFTEDGYASFW